ncbi:MAG: integrase arm-type DNA-binding domain-containing protein [Rhodoferax sp.]|nr:integrase arm-type DNA-binding domain-containing protein [Rhodoferax sp.]
MALTDTFIKQVKHSGRASGDKHSDGKGLYLHVSATGKYWRMAYRFAGKQKTLAIGVYPATSLSDAREARDKARKHLAMDKDPSDAKREDKARQAVAANDTLDATAFEWLELRKPTWSESHYIRESRNVTKDLLPWLGARSIGTIKPIELLTVIRKVEERGSLDVAHRVHQTAHGIWCYAVATARAERDITPDIQKALKPHIKQNYPAIIDPVQLGQLLRTTDAYTGGPVVKAAFKLVPILFQRPGNLRTMRWADIDFDRALWTIPSEEIKRTKEGKLNGRDHEIPLPTQALAILRDIQHLTGAGEYVFTGGRDPKKPMSEAALTVALAALGYKEIHSWHGYRATGRTILREVLKFPVEVIEANMAHVSHVTHGGAYDRATHLQERSAMLQTWADYLDKLRAGAEVIQLTRAA